MSDMPYAKAMTSTSTPSIRRNLVNAACLAGGFLTASAVLLSLYFTGVIEVEQPQSQSALGETSDAIRPEVSGSPAAVFEKHADECWSMGQDPKATLPSAAIVQDYNGAARYTQDRAEVDEAFSDVLHQIGSEEPAATSFRVIALCL